MPLKIASNDGPVGGDRSNSNSPLQMFGRVAGGSMGAAALVVVCLMCALVDEAAYQNSKGPFDLTPIFWWRVLPYKISEFLKKIRKITSFQFNNSLYFRGRYLFSGFFSATFIQL